MWDAGMFGCWEQIRAKRARVLIASPPGVAFVPFDSGSRCDFCSPLHFTPSGYNLFIANSVALKAAGAAKSSQQWKTSAKVMEVSGVSG